MQIVQEGKVTIVRDKYVCCRCEEEKETIMPKQHWEKFRQVGAKMVCVECLKQSDSEEERKYTGELIISDVNIFDTKIPGLKTIERNPGFIYFIQGERGGPIKIGYTTDVMNRLKTLQTGYPYPLKLLLAIHGSLEKERNIQKEFINIKLQGEWFEPSEKLINYMDGIKSNPRIRTMYASDFNIN
jgi:hypothetical protein